MACGLLRVQGCMCPRVFSWSEVCPEGDKSVNLHIFIGSSVD